MSIGENSDFREMTIWRPLRPFLWGVFAVVLVVDAIANNERTFRLVKRGLLLWTVTWWAFAVIVDSL